MSFLCTGTVVSITAFSDFHRSSLEAYLTAGESWVRGLGPHTHGTRVVSGRAGFWNPASLVPQPDLSLLCACFSARAARGCLKSWWWKVYNPCLWSQPVCGTPVPLQSPPRDQASSQVHQERLLSRLFCVRSWWLRMAPTWDRHTAYTFLF